jgi:hypothetical protein
MDYLWTIQRHQRTLRVVRFKNRLSRPEKRGSGLSSSERGVGAPIPTPGRTPDNSTALSHPVCQFLRRRAS